MTINLTDDIRREHETKLGRPIDITMSSEPVDGFDDEWVVAKVTYDTRGDIRGTMWQRIHVSHSTVMTVHPKYVVSLVGSLLNEKIDWFIEHYGVKPGGGG